MNVGMQDRPKFIAAVISMALALLLIGRWYVGSESSASAAPTDQVNAATAIAIPSGKNKARQASSLDPTLHYAQWELTENERYEGSGRNIFRAYSDEPPGTPHPKARPNPSPRLDRRAAPTIRLKFFGLAATSRSERKACLTQDGDVFIGSEGDIIDRRYRIVRIGANALDLEDLVENIAYTITLER